MLSEASTSCASSSQRLELSQKQRDAVSHCASNNHTILIAPTGSGKSVICLTTIQQRKQQGTTRRAIIAAPPTVLANFPNEIAKWGHLDLTAVLLTGSPKDRLDKLHSNAEVLLISLQNLDWLLQQRHGADTIIVDELSKAAGKQTQKLRNKGAAQLTTRIGMTATPVSENFEKLYAMARIIDGGKALGTRKDSYFAKYFTPLDFKGYRHQLRAGADKEIMERIKPLIYSVPVKKSETLPPIVFEEIEFLIPKTTRDAYDHMRRDMLIEVNGAAAVAPNLAVMSAKLRQLASGFILDEDSNAQQLDDERASTAQEWAQELEGRKGVVLYEYNHQRQQLESALADYDTVSVYGGVDKEPLLDQFKTTKQILIAQQNTLSHGVDGLQHFCNDLLFYQPVWSQDTTEQAYGRLWRQGQQNPVVVTTLVAVDSVDDVVLSRLNTKAQNMKLFMHHLNT